jgi:hypothetical protein
MTILLSPPPATQRLTTRLSWFSRLFIMTLAMLTELPTLFDQEETERVQ